MMKKIILIFTILFPLLVVGQNYNISQYNNQTITTCTGNFYDSGGPTNNFLAAESFTVTLAPSTVGGFVRLNFTSWNVGSGDALEVFDGPNVSSPSYGVLSSTMSPVGMVLGASILNTSGKITLRWSSATSNPGWEAAISCGLPCQPIEAGLFSSIPPFHIDSGIYYIDICPHDTIKIFGNAVFPNNNQYYHQDTSTSIFYWNFGNNKLDTGRVVTVVYDSIRGYNIRLKVVDSMGCVNSNAPEIRVRISTKPNFNGTTVSAPVICQGETAILTGKVNAIKWKATSSLSVAGQTYLPDGSGASYTSTVNFTQFAPGQTLTNPNHFLGVCATMEHSYLGDLNITLTCPSNQTVILKSYPGGTSTFLGEPIDNDAITGPGLGYNYCWRPIGTTTMVGAAGFYQHNFTDANGTSYTNASFLPPSTGFPATATAGPPYTLLDYNPIGSFSSLLGCPLNGTWTITVTDNLFSDNGYIFSWGIDLSPSILPVNWSYTPDFSNGKSWLPDPTIVSTTGSSIEVKPVDTGYHYYTFRATDNLGCTYDTIVRVYVLPSPKVNLGNDTVICEGSMIVLKPGNFYSSATYAWNSGDNTPTIMAILSGIYSVTVSYNNPSFGNKTCIGIDSMNLINVKLANANLSADTCSNGPFVIDAENVGAHYIWSTGDTTQTLNINSSGTYAVTVNYLPGSPCNSNDSKFVRIIPDPVVDLGPDLKVCRNEKILLDISQPNHTLYDYIWQPIALNQGSFLIYKMPIGLHTIKVDVTGCITVSDEILVDVVLCEVKIPNVITPNGDNLNDFFVIEQLEHYPNSILKVYSRWGKKVYESDNYQNDWNGEDFADGVYFFILLVNDADINGKGEKSEYNGTITIMRK